MRNIEYPPKFNSDGTLATNDSSANNSSRISLLLDVVPGQRPLEPEYGTTFYRVEQEPRSNTGLVADACMQFRRAVTLFLKSYLILNKLEVKKTGNNTRGIDINVQYTDL